MLIVCLCRKVSSASYIKSTLLAFTLNVGNPICKVNVETVDMLKMYS